jgi:hypothetical protein
MQSTAKTFESDARLAGILGYIGSSCHLFYRILINVRVDFGHVNSLFSNCISGQPLCQGAIRGCDSLEQLSQMLIVVPPGFESDKLRSLN